MYGERGTELWVRECERVNRDFETGSVIYWQTDADGDTYLHMA